jgi:cytoplasmic iron level regulating protein YaaA (DUF328/UPF0246 family)
MKIILSPSKTQDFTSPYNTAVFEPSYLKEATKLAHKIAKMSKKNLSALMTIEGDLLEKTYQSYKSFDGAVPAPAITTYTGLVFFHLNLDTYNDEDLTYMKDHLILLSALYGALNPFDGIKPYRLDMKMPITKQSLYHYWHKIMLAHFKDEPLIIDLASNEFSKMVPYPKTSIGFLQEKDGHYKNLATYSKMARGQLLDLMIKGHINDLETLKLVTFEGYTYNNGLSTEDKLIFTRLYTKP